MTDATDWHRRVYRNGPPLIVSADDAPREVTPSGEWTMKDALRAEDMRTARLASRMVCLDEVDETPWGGEESKA